MTNSDEGASRRRGRPALPAEDRKSTNLKFRTRPILRERIEAAAAESGRTVSEEVENRLEKSFEIIDAEKIADAAFEKAKQSISQNFRFYIATLTEDNKLANILMDVLTEIKSEEEIYGGGYEKFRELDDEKYAYIINYIFYRIESEISGNRNPHSYLSFIEHEKSARLGYIQSFWKFRLPDQR
ncbi:hypothetical protein [Methylobacterium currus]|uniref:hypothetical protein n=1 Tax=Methylobacterium currus TaxID=2051553 RepID=UPI000F510268|nr:hypothetical protein [Methylobacterium currus]